MSTEDNREHNRRVMPSAPGLVAEARALFEPVFGKLTVEYIEADGHEVGTRTGAVKSIPPSRNGLPIGIEVVRPVKIGPRAVKRA